MMGSASKVRFKSVDYPPGVTDLFSLIRFLDDRKEYQRYAEEITGLIAEANTAIEKVGKANEIDKLYSAAKADRDRVAGLNEKAVKEAQKILDEAKSESLNLIARAKEDLEKAEAERSKYEMLTKAKSAELSEREALLEKAEKEAKERSAALDAREAEVTAALDAIEEKKRILASL